MAGARALWRATGMTDDDFDKPIVAVANSFTQFVPGHVHLRDLGCLVAGEIQAAGGVAKEFNTIAVDDGIAMGHGGMLYSLPSRELIADSVEYMLNAHCADALVCISNCDKITPGMLMAAMRLNVPTVFVSGGPMEAGKTRLSGGQVTLNLISAMTIAGTPSASDADVDAVERSACPTCGSCSGMFTANSMNCLTEALGLSLPGNGTLLATHADRERLFLEAGRTVVDLARRYYEKADTSVLPREVANRTAFHNAMALDIAMGGSTNTVLHVLAAAHEGDVDFTMADIDAISRRIPHICKVAPATDRYHVEDVHRAGGVMGILGELDRAGLIDTTAATVHSESLAAALEKWDIGRDGCGEEAQRFFRAGPAGIATQHAFSQDTRWPTLDLNRAAGCIRSVNHAYSPDGGLAVLHGNVAPEGCIVKTAGIDEGLTVFAGPARVYESQESAVDAILGADVRVGDVVVVRYEGPKGGPGMQEMLYPTTYIKSRGLGRACALVTDGRFSGGTSGLSIGHVSPEAAEGGPIALVRDGDLVSIDIPSRTITLEVDEAVLDLRRQEEEAHGAAAWTPRERDRVVSLALRAYAAFTTSAARGAVRDVDRISVGAGPCSVTRGRRYVDLAMSKLTHYVFQSTWEVEAPFADVCRVLADVETYPEWWPEIRTVQALGDGRFELTARALLPYELRFVSENRARAAQEPGVIDAALTGDLEGFARWTVEDRGSSCRLVYDQEVDTRKALLNTLAPAARPAFKANHGVMMRHGQAGLRTYMAGYRRGASRA